MCEKLTIGRRLPSLNGLRAFEAMGRLGSATRASVELGVTPSAVSRQVQALSVALGGRLFDGPRHALTLTPEGRRLLEGLTAGLDTLAGAVRSVRVDPEATVAVHASLAVKWLIPRLGDFERRHSDLTLHLRDLPVTAIRQREADLVVRFLDRPQMDQAGVQQLAPNHIGLVVRPDQQDRMDELPRLSTSSHLRGWRDWEALSGRSVPGRGERTLSHLHYVLDAAVAGLGVAVLPWILVSDAVEKGELAAPFGFVADGGGLAAVSMSDQPAHPVRTVGLWLKAQAAATAARVPLQT